MAYSYNLYTSTTAGQVDFQFSWSYIKAEHVKLFVNYTEIAQSAVTRGAGVAGFQIYTSGSNTYARLNDTNGLASANTRVEVRRFSSIASVLVDYADGSTLTAGDLDTSNLQNLYIAQELDDAQKQGISISSTTGQPTLGNQRLTEVTDPTAAQDAATKNYVDTTTQPVDAELTELATMSSGTASSLADLTNTEVQILDGATVTTDELNKLDGVTATTAEINYVDGVTSNVQTQLDAKQPLDAELTELATMHTDTAAALADLTQAEVQILDGATLSTAELNFVDGVTSALQTQLDAKQPLDADLTNLAGCQTGASANIALLTSGEIAILDGATLSTAELNTLSGITSSTGELNKLDGVTSTTANLNIVSGMTKATSLTSNSDTELPTSKAVADHVTSVVNALGGFVAINGPTNFPATQPDQGVVVSIKDVGSGFTTSSNEITITNGAGSGKNVKITGFPSEYAAATLVDDTGLQVTSNKSASDFSSSPQVHQYVYHKQLAKESDVKQLSDDINAFNERYRTATGSNPSSNNHAGDLFFSQDTDKMYVRNAANNAWDEVVSVGEFFINTLSSLGSGSDNPPGGSATFNGTARKFTLSNPPSVAQQLIVSINGVIQKPNSGAGFPSEGFSLNGSALQLAAAPATDAPFFIITIGSTVNIGTPSAGTVDLAKLDTSNTGSTGQFLKKDGSTEGIGWATVSSDLVGDTSPQLGGDLDVSGHEIVSTSNGAIELNPNGTGNINLKTAVGGTTNLTSGGDVVFSSGVTNAICQWDYSEYQLEFWDSVKASFGSDSDLQIYHDGAHSFIRHDGGGSLLIKTDGADEDIYIDAGQSLHLRTTSSYESAISCIANGAVELYYDNSKKLFTQSWGVEVTGTVKPDQLDLDDTHKIRIGSSADLEIYHDGSNSYIKDAGTGSLLIDSDSQVIFRTDTFTVNNAANSENILVATADGAVELYHDNAKVFYTQDYGGTFKRPSGGATVLEVIGCEGQNAELQLRADDGDDEHDLAKLVASDSSGLYIQTRDTSAWKTNARFINGGAVELYYNNTAVLQTISQGIKLHNGGSSQIHYYDVNTATIRTYTNSVNLRWYDDVNDDNIMQLSQVGDLNIDGSYYNSGVDYAEYFESTDGSAIPIGTTVVLDNGKVRAATSSETPIGVIRPKTSGTSVTGGVNQFNWQGKYLVDDYDGRIMESAVHCTWTDSDKVHQQCWKDRPPTGVTIPEDAEETTRERPKLNPDFDKSKTYVPRSERTEWNCVGLLGQIPITKGQPTSSNWIKMKDRTSTVELWMVK